MRARYASPFAMGAGSQRALSLWPFNSSKEQATGSQVWPEAAGADAEAVTDQEAILTAASSPSDPLAAGDVSSTTQEAITHASEQVQTLADMGQLSGWINVRAAQTVLDWLVEATGMPWWLTIAAVTLSVRLLVLPAVLYGQKNAIRLANIQPKMQSHMKDIQYAKSNGDHALLAKSVESVQKLMKENDCHPARSLIVPAVQTPLFITFFFALRGLAEAGLPSMQNGGLAWFTDLTSADPYFILPVLSSLSMLAVLETGAEMGTAGGNVTAQAKMMRNAFRALSVITIPFIYHFPTAVFCYWLTNGMLSLIQLWTLNLTAVRRALNLPERLQHNAEEKMAGKSDKQMGFWDSIAAGKASQASPTSVRVIRRGNRNETPSVLQDQRGMEESRERALKKLQRGAPRSKPEGEK